MVNSINVFKASNSKSQPLMQGQITNLSKIQRESQEPLNNNIDSFNKKSIKNIGYSNLSQSQNFRIYKTAQLNRSFYQTNFSGGTNIPKISIIVPVYNTEKYLKKGLNSLRKQTLKDIEIICVNDGSKDNSLRILKTFAAKDSRFKIIDQQNQGIGVTRNNGLKAARGEYVGFMDPDDWLDKTACETLYNQAKVQGSDFIAFNYKNINETDGKIKVERIEKTSFKWGYNFSLKEPFTWRDIKSDKLKGLSSVAWNKLFKKSFIDEHSLKFTPASMAEDQEFIIGAILNAKKISFCNEPFYNYLVRKRSASHGFSDNNFQVFDVFSALDKVVKDSGMKNEVSKDYDDYTGKLFSRAYKGIAPENRGKFEQMCKEKLEPEHYQKVLNQIKRDETEPSFLNKVFSIRTEQKLGINHKIITLFGKKIEL